MTMQIRMPKLPFTHGQHPLGEILLPDDSPTRRDACDDFKVQGRITERVRTLLSLNRYCEILSL